MCCQFLQLLYEHVLRLQIKMRNSAHGLRRSVSCAEGVLMPLPHIHCFWDFLCAFFASHCRSPHSIWKCLFSFTINFAEIMTFEPYWRLSASCSRWSETDLKANMRVLRVWTIPEHLLLAILPWAFFSQVLFLEFSWLGAEVGTLHQPRPEHSFAWQGWGRNSQC